MEPTTPGTGMAPVAAVLTVFALVFAFLCWLRLLRVCFRQHLLLGLIAIFLPPLALLILLPGWEKERDMFALAAGALVAISIAALV
ncbi:hypothetical protein [Microbulbifer thermotolerans]|uniref:Uncharacterized protein n=1 Tax=Microbulbifer thermotolerans TaxID=252514 RepID=A0A143HQW8_MICTH|nr:hypothetical protein [Microbulbifer thermotolerans]AMX03810.1 hypothetical protein A3224_15530 [Microbulbifer thermotolerans]MCX2778697.1 hypothetical protein [Microbulbifer thermotolerans]MCX2783753.1 hypothetical protein [Microbulbifer thermotolerans]MCX2794166.1 hypothetical protein [Microbulbifer thermotolerans]MCX2803115.1 hypothetical protein [Microbulbifer thermotolerans]